MGMAGEKGLTAESKPSGSPLIAEGRGSVPKQSVARRTLLGLVTAAGAGLILWLDSLWEPGYVYAAGGLAVVLIATDEFCGIVNAAGRRVNRPWMLFAAAALFLVQWAGWAFDSFPDPWVTGFAFICACGAAVLCGRVLQNRIDSAQEALGLSLAGIIYVPLLFGFVTALRARWGVSALVVLLAVCKSGDSAAYFVGKYLGKQKLAADISPAKTVEGAIGAVAVSALVAVLLSAVSPWRIMGPALSVVYGVLLGLVAIVGDLAESVLKRQSMVKDSGRLMIGFGGMLDMLDDVLFAAPFTFLFFWISGIPTLK